MTKGSCLCGKLSYEYTGEPIMTALCHCNQCRKGTSSAFTTNIMIPLSAWQLSGTPKVYEFTQESGVKLKQYFCDTCGSMVAKEGDAEQYKGNIIVQAGTVDGDTNAGRPGSELFVKYKAEWLPDIAGEKVRELPWTREEMGLEQRG